MDLQLSFVSMVENLKHQYRSNLNTVNRRLAHRHVFTLITLAFLFSGGATAEVTQVDNGLLKKLRVQGAVLVDVRRADEWKRSGVIEGSHLLTFFDRQGRYDLAQWMADVDKIAEPGKPLVLICEVGGRTANIAKLLDQKLGVPGVHNLTQGIRHWIRSGEPVVVASPVN